MNNHPWSLLLIYTRESPHTIITNLLILITTIPISKDISNAGFLCGFDEGEVEKPVNGVDGDCVIYYNGEHKGYKMVVKLVNGKRDGRAVIVSNGFAYLKLEYRNGRLTGNVEKLNRYLMTELKGYLENGIEVGLFEEYDTDGKVAWRGTYRCGRRYSRVVKSEIMRGYYEEIQEENGTLLSISQYDSVLRNKNGRCFEFEDGMVVRECVYENGEKTCVIREYQNGIPQIEDDGIAGNGTYLSVLLDEPNDDSMIVYDIRAAYGFGVVRKDEKCYEVQWSSEGDRVIAVDLICNRVSGYNNRELVTIQYHDEVIDLDANGRRWEGGVRDGKPFGNGILYNTDGRKEYEGFMINQVKVCYGKEYYCDIETVKYAGCYFDDKRFGYGVLYDRSGCIEYDGLWRNNEPYSSEPNNRMIDNHAELLCIPNNAFNSLVSFISLNYFYTLKHVVIGYSCFRSARSFSLDGVRGLESIVIESGSFTMVHAEHAEMGYQQKGGVFQIVNCPKLTTFQIGDWSFVDYHSFVIRQLPALQSLQIGNHCFCGVSSFSLIGLEKDWIIRLDLPQLKTVTLGCRRDYPKNRFTLMKFGETSLPSFACCRSVVFENLPRLQALEIHANALSGDSSDEQKSFFVPPYNYKNTLTMRNLPSLVSIGCTHSLFENMGTVILENIPQLSQDNIENCYHCFYYTYSLQSNNAIGLESFIRQSSEYIKDRK